MKSKITQTLLGSLKPQEKPYRVHDTEQPGLFLRVQPTGRLIYMVTWGRNKEKTIGRVGRITLAQARAEAARFLAEIYAHGEPLAVTHAKKGASSPLLIDFINDTYLPWFKVNHKGHDKTKHTLLTCFVEIHGERLANITSLSLEEIRTRWLRSGNSPATANRKMGSMSGLLSRAVDWGYLESSPLQDVAKSKTDTSPRVRYLSSSERESLKKALVERENEARSHRLMGNTWRVQRQIDQLPVIEEWGFSDHLVPMVTISLNTGVRRGELFNLRWADFLEDQSMLTIAGAGTKNSQTRHIPLNGEAIDILRRWRKQKSESDRHAVLPGSYIFPGADGRRITDVKTAWKTLLKQAGIVKFRWHDMRHDFASRLVMAGVPLNTVRDLLGHSDIKMTLRYAHLAPDSKAAAVSLLNAG